MIPAIGLDTLGSVGKWALNGLKFADWGPVKKALSYSSKPIFMGLDKREKESDKEYQNRLLNRNKTTFQKIRDTFAWGDLISIVGAIGWIVSSFISRLGGGKDQEGASQESTLKSWLKFGFKVLTIVGAPSAWLGRQKEFHFKEFLDPAIARKVSLARIKSDLVRDFDVEKDNYSRFLRYNEGIWKVLRSLHKVKDGQYVQKFLTGPSGTGKTQAVKMICSKIKKDAKAKGQEVVIREMNVPRLLKEIDSQVKEDSYLGQALEISGATGTANVVKRDTLEMLDTAIATIEDEINASREIGQRCIFVLDEVDQIFQIEKIREQHENRTLDWEKLKSIMKRLQRMLDEGFGDVIMTSNEDVEYFEKLPIHPDAQKSRDGFLSRIQAKRLYIGIPDAETQSAIISAYLLAVCDNRKIEEVFDNEIISRLKELTGQSDLNIDSSLSAKNKTKKLREIECALASIIYNVFTSQRHLYGGLAGREFQEAINVNLSSDFELKSDEFNQGIREKRPVISLSYIKGYLDHIRSNYEKDNKKNILLKQDAFAESLLIKLFENPEIYQKLLENTKKEKSVKSEESRQQVKNPFNQVLAEQFSGIYSAVQADNTYIFYPKDFTVHPELGGERYFLAHRIRPLYSDPNIDLSDPNNWVVETLYNKLKPQSSGNITAESYKNCITSASYTTPVSGAKFLEQVDETFKQIHRRARSGAYGDLFSKIAQLAEEKFGKDGKFISSILNAISDSM